MEDGIIMNKFNLMNKKNKLTRKISYCYPSSPYAISLGYGDSGCYAVYHGDETIYPCETKKQAIKIFNAFGWSKVEIAWDCMTRSREWDNTEK